MTERTPALSEAPIDPSHQPSGARPRAPLVGVIAGIVLFAGFAGWAGMRIQAATRAKRRRYPS
jgi:hypothetical protein